VASHGRELVFSAVVATSREDHRLLTSDAVSAKLLKRVVPARKAADKVTEAPA